MKDYNTDKIRSGLLVRYEEFFKEFKDKEIRYLEIGIKQGGSLLWAQDYFKPGSRIFGMDKNPCPIVSNECLVTFIGEQNDSDRLKYIGNTFGQFDIIIDDASHQIKETRNTFKCLWPYLKVGGWYVIEDWAPGIGADTYKGLIEVLVEILLNKNELGISEIYILAPNTGNTFAAFRKR
jgi:cephalosporin hydroxylase